MKKFVFFTYIKLKDATAEYGEDCSIDPCNTATISLLTCSSNVCSCPTGYFYVNKQCGNNNKISDQKKDRIINKIFVYFLVPYESSGQYCTNGEQCNSTLLLTCDTGYCRL